MSGPKKTSIFADIDKKIQENKSKQGYQNIVQPFTTNTASLDQEELESSAGTGIAPSITDFLTTSKKEKEAVSVQQIEATQAFEAEDKKALEDSQKQIEEIEKQETIAKAKIAQGNDIQKQEGQQELAIAKETKANIAKQNLQNPELDKLNTKIKKLEDPYKWDGAKTDTGFFSNPLKWADEAISNVFANTHNAIVNPENKMKPAEKAEYKALVKQRDTFYKPIAAQKREEWNREVTDLDIKLADPNLPLTKRWQLKNLKDQVLDQQRELDAYSNGEGGADSFLRKLGGVSYRTNETEGAQGFRPFTDLIDNVFNFIYKDDLENKVGKAIGKDAQGNNVYEKTQAYDTLSEDDKATLGIYAKLEEDKTFLSDKQKWSYNTVESTMGSVGFVRDMVVGGQLTKTLGAALGLEGAVLNTGLATTRATGSATLGRIAAGTVKAGELGVNYAIQSQINPQFTNQELMKGSHIERDDQGNITNIYVKDKLHDYMSDVYAQTAKVYTAEKEKLETKGSLSPEEQQRLTYLKVKLGEENDLAEHSLQEELATFKPKSLMEAELLGFAHTSTENLAELYTGKVLGKIGTGISKIPGVNKYATKLASSIDNASASFNSTKLGRLYKNWTNATGRLNVNGTRVIGSIPEEIVEEYVTSGMNSVLAADPKEFIDMFDTQAVTDIAAQTLLMSGMFGLGGNVQTHAKLGYNKLINKRIADLKPQVETAQARLPQLEALIQAKTATVETTDNSIESTPEQKNEKAELDTLIAEKKEIEKTLLRYDNLRNKPSLTGLNIVSNITGDKTGFSATRNYIESRTNIRKSIDALKLASTDAGVNQILNLSSLEGFGIADQKLRIQSLRAEGKTEEANLVEKSMFQNLVLQSFRSDTQDEFKKALKEIKKDTNLSVETQLQIGKAEEQLESLSKVYELNKHKPNIQNIITLAMEKSSAKEGIEKIETDKNKIAQDVRNEIDAFKDATGDTTDYSLETLFTREFEDQAEQDKYDAFVEKLSNYNNTIIDAYLGLEDSKNKLKNHLGATTLALTEAIHPSLESVNKDKFLNQIQEDLSDIVEGKGNVINSKAEFNYRNQFVPTEDFINELFDNRKSEWVGSFSQGKISEKQFEEAKNKALVQFKRQEVMKKLATLTNTQAEVEAIAEQEIVETVEPEVITISDKAREEEFLDFTAGVEEDLDIFFDFDPDAPDFIISDDEFDPMIEDDKYTPEQLAFVKKAMMDMVSQIQNITGQEKVSFTEAISQYFKAFKNKEVLKANFRHFAKGWRENGYTLENSEILSAFDTLFNIEKDVMSVEQGIINLFEFKVETNPVPAPVALEQKTETLEQEIAVENAVITSYDEENMPVAQSAVEEIKSQRTLSILPKLAYNLISYTNSVVDGVFTRKSTSSTLNIKEEDLIDPRDLVNPDMYLTGTPLNIEVASEDLWSKVEVSNGMDAEGNVTTITFADWVEARELKNPNFRSTQEFKDKQPMFYTDAKGKRLAFVQDVDWYNPFNVANPSGLSNNPNAPTPEWQNHINEGKTNTRNLRNAIVNGLTQVTVNRISQEGVFHKLLEEEPLISINESNPQATLAVQRGSTLENLPKEFANGTSILLNKPTDFDITQTNGHTWAIYRIGTTTNDKGELVKTYRALPINRQVTEEQVNNVRWALAAFAAYSGNSLPAEYRMSKDQALENFIKPLNKATGLNISDPKQLMDYIKGYFQLTPNAILGLRRPTDKKVYTAESIVLYLRLLIEDNTRLNDASVIDLFSQHTSNKLFNSSYKAVTLSKTGVQPLLKNNKPVSYEEYLKDNLLINIKSFNVGTDSKPVYATSIQPIINVEYKEVVATQPSLVEKIQEAAKEAIATVEDKKVVPLEDHITFLNSIGVSLESFEEDDALIESTDKLVDLFKLIGNLNIVQEKTIRQFIVHAIGEKIDLDYKTKISRTKISNEIKAEVNLQLRPIKVAIKSLLGSLDENNVEKSAELRKAYTSVLSSITEIQDNFEDFFDKSFEDIKKQTQLNEIEEDEVINTDDDILSEKDYNKDSIEESGKSKASYRLRRFLHKIPKFDNEGNKVTGFLGFTEYMTFNDVYNELTKVLTLGSEVTSDYNSIVEKLKQSEFPFVKEIIAKLDTADQQIKNEFVYNFVRHTLSSKFAMYDNGANGTSLKMYDTNANEIGRVIKNKWTNENKASSLYLSDGSFNTAYAQVLVAEYDSWGKDVKSLDTDALKSWLENLGMFMNSNTWKDIVDKGFFNSGKQYSFEEIYTLNQGGLFVKMVNFLKEGIANPADYNFNKDNNIFKDLSGVITAIANIEAKYNPQLIALSFRDSGKNISTQVPTKYVTDLVQELKRSVNGSSTLIEDLQSLSLSEDSILLNLLSNEPSFKNLFELSHIGLTAIKEKGTSPTKAGITDLGELDYDMLTVTGFQDRKTGTLPSTFKIEGISMRIASMLFPTMSDKTTGLMMKTGVFDFLKDGDLLFDTTDNGVAMGADIKALLFKQLVLPELKRIMKFHNEVKATNIKNYDKAATLFHFLPIMNTLKSESGIRIIEELGAIDYTLDQVVEKYQGVFEAAIEQVINQEVEHKKALWQEQTTTSSDGSTISKMFDTTYFSDIKKLPGKNYDIAVYDYVLNSMLFNADVFKVFAGDIANYSQDKLFKGEDNIQDIKDDAKYVSINRQIGVNLGKRLALLIAPGNKLANSYNEQYNQIMLQDATDITENASYIIGLKYGKEAVAEAKPLLEKYDKANSILNRYEQGEFFISPENLERVKGMMSNLRNQLAKTFPKVDGYFDIESTDAQEYTTASEHIETLYRMGRLSDKDYQKILTKIGSTGKNAYLTKRELKLVLQPIKPVQTGTYINKAWDINRVVYIKSSSFPLLPQFTAGTKLDALRVKIEELESKTGRFTRASFQTANKVGATKNVVNPFDVNSLEKIKEYGENDLDSTVLVLNRNNFRIQQDVPFKSDKKSDDKVSMGTQFFKLLFGDGIINENNYTFNGQTLTGKELYAKYNNSFSTIVETRKQELFLDLGLSTNGEVTNESLFMTKLQALLIKEATDRGYSVKSLRGLRIEKLAAKAGFYYEFKSPLWLSSDSNRYESLLNSIVTNRIMKHKMPGNGFVAGSESGLRLKENLKGIDQSRMVFLDTYNGVELQGAKNENGVFTNAQVFVPSKFKNSNKELIDLFDNYSESKGEGTYLIRNKDGKLGLKPGMIDKELLNMFSFRTPTSSHVSGASVEIAGFLPSEMGDLMIVPKNFTKQKGLDYDIDKESTYTLNHFMMENGKLEVLTQGHKEDALAKLQAIVDKLELENLTLDRRANIRKEILDLAIKNNFSFITEDEVEEWIAPEVSVKEKMNRKALEFDRKLAENDFVRAHLGVFNNPNNVVQDKINSILSIDFAKEQADKFETLNEEGKKNAKIQQYIAKDPNLSLLDAENKYKEEALNFSMLTYSYQKEKMGLGSIGKIAIGVYANYTTFNGLIQQNSVDIFIPMMTEDGMTNKSLTIGKFNSDGVLGAEKTLDGERTIAEVFAEKENTATDNEKEQVLGRVGVNESTINVDAHMTLRGFDKDENGNSIPYLLLSQPAVVQLNAKRKAAKGLLGEFRKDEDLVHALVYELSNGEVSYFGGKAIYSDSITADPDQEPVPYYAEGKLLTGNAMLDGIKNNGSDKEIQLHTLLTYIELEKEARGISKIQKTINANTLGKSMIESQLKYQGLKELATSPALAGASSLLGDFIEITEDNSKPEGYLVIGDFYVKPTTPQGQIVINGLYYGNNIYKDFFPYQESGINSLVMEILGSQGKVAEQINETTLIENFETIIEEVKKYIYSREGNNIFNGSPRDKRFELFKDTETNTSLSTYTKNLLRGDITANPKGVKAVRNNTLIKSFIFDTGKGENELSLIKYNNAQTDNLDEESLYNAIPELIILNAPLPPRNGKPYSTRMLAEDLVNYAYLEGGVQEATQFIKFIPVEYLETVGNYEDKTVIKAGVPTTERVFIPANRKLQSFNTKRNADIDVFAKAFGFKEEGISTFTRQFFQHKPDKAAKTSFKKVSVDKATGVLTLKPGAFTSVTPPTFISIKNQRTATEKYSLYEHMGNGQYRRLPLLGQMGISEYDYRNDNAISLKDTEVTIVTPVAVPIIAETNNFMIDSNTTIKNILEQVANAGLSPEYAHLAEAAKTLVPLAKAKGDFVVNNGMDQSGRYGRETGNISINLMKTLGQSEDKMAMVFMHEFIHSISVHETLKYFNKDGLTLRTDVAIPSYVTDLLTVFNDFRRIHKTEIEILDAKIQQQKDNSLGVEYTEREKDLIYAGSNIREFLAVSLTSPVFFEEMSKLEYKKSGKSIFQKLSDVIMKMLNSIFPGLKEDTMAQAAISQSLRFIVEENKPIAIVETKSAPINTSSEPTSMGAIIEDNEIPDFGDVSENVGNRIQKKYPEVIPDLNIPTRNLQAILRKGEFGKTYPNIQGTAFEDGTKFEGKFEIMEIYFDRPSYIEISKEEVEFYMDTIPTTFTALVNYMWDNEYDGSIIELAQKLLDENTTYVDTWQLGLFDEQGTKGDMGDLMIDNPEDLLTLPDCI